MAKLVIFDVDGTLVDSQNIIAAAKERTFLACGLTPPTRAQALSVVGLSLREAFTQLAGADAPIEDLSAGYKQAYWALRQARAHPEIFFDGAREIVESLALRADVILALATGKSRRGVDDFLARAAWENHFASVRTADDHPSKPAPDMILAALAETGIAPEAALMIGDTTFDMLMARAAGVRAIGVDWGYHRQDALRAAGADMILSDFSALEAILNSHPG